MNKDAYYFPHFSNARHDRKIKRLRKDLGVKGYGIYFMILEVLRDEEDFRYPIKDVDLLEDDFNEEEAIIQQVINDFELFEIDEDDNFYSPKFIEFLQPYLEEKRVRRLNGIKGNLIRYKHATKEELNGMSADEILRLNEMKTKVVGGESGGESHSDRNKSKVKESKENDSKYTTEDLERIYSEYPLPVKKGKALPEIEKALKKVDYNTLLSQVKLYAKTVKQGSMDYVQDPHNWFIDQRWEEDPKVWRARKGDKSDEFINPDPATVLYTYQQIKDKIERSGSVEKSDYVEVEKDGKKFYKLKETW